MPYSTRRIRLEIEPQTADYQIRAGDSGELSFKIATVIREFLHDHPNGGWNAVAPALAAIEGALLPVNTNRAACELTRGSDDLKPVLEISQAR